MRRSTQDPDEPLLFDLPLIPQNAPPPAPRTGERERREEGTGQRTVPHRDDAPSGARGLESVRPAAEPELKRAQRLSPATPVAAPKPDAERPTPWAPAGKRYAAGGADVAVHLALLVGVLLAARGLGVQPRLQQWPAFLVFVLTFSFFYTVVPLAFWGQTLGMAWSGIVSRNRNGEPLSFDQTARRWLGGLVTVALLGLPLLVPFRGRTLADLVSGSETYPSGSGDESGSRLHTA